MNKKLKWSIIGLFVILFSFGVYKEAYSAEVGLGISHAISHDSKWMGQHVMFGNRNWFLEVARLGGEPRLPDTYRYVVGYRVDWREPYMFSPFMKMGAAYFKDIPDYVVSDHWAYDMSVGLRLFKVIDFEYNHNSTGGRSERNKGNDLLTLTMVIPIK